MKSRAQKLTKERWEYLKQDLLKLKGINRIISDGRSPYNIGRNKKKRELKKLEKM